MPTIDDLIQIKKKSKQATTTATAAVAANKSNKLEETKPKTVKVKTTPNNETVKLNTVELVESKLINEEKKKKKYEQMSQVLILFF